MLVLSVAGAADSVDRTDFWLDAENSFRVVGAAATGGRRAVPGVTADYTCKVSGDCSVRCTLDGGGKAIVFGPAFRTGWPLAPEWTLQLEASAASAAGATFTLVDGASHRSQPLPLTILAYPAWQHVEARLSGIAPAGFNWKDVRQVEIAFTGGAPKTVWLDAVRFTGPDGAEIALTDIRTADRIAAEVATRPERIARAFGGKISGRAQTNLSRLFANLWMERDVAAANRELLAIYSSKDPKVLADYGLEYSWALTATPILCRLYFTFGSHGLRKPGRLSNELETAILAMLWERTELKNDLHYAKQSTWNLTGSENHDINAKIGDVLVSQIFMHDPAYASRVLPDLGRGAGSGYWFHKTEETGRFHGPEGRAERTLSGEFRAQEHFAAWVEFMKEYFRERARRGFFLEKGSPTYMKYTMSFILDLHDFCEDAELKRMAGMFLDLFWAEWAQDQIRGMRGGEKTREHGVLDFQQDSMFSMASYLFGGPADLNPALTGFAVSDYRPPAVVWNLALNRSGRGAYAYVSHQPGEERPELPRPPGMERTLVCSPDSRLKRYSWVTPDYIMGTRMDYPLAVHSHLSWGSVWLGITFPTSTRGMIFPRDIEQEDGETRMAHESAWHSVQEGPVLITQQNRGGVTVVNPDWFPRADQDAKPAGVYFAPGLDRVEEEAGWIFAQAGNAYVAVRVVAGMYADPKSKEWLTYQASAPLEEPLDPQAYTWSRDRTIAVLKGKHSPVIFEAGRRADFPALADFRRHILGNKITLTKIVVPGDYTLTYTSNGRTFYFNAANTEIPKIDGRSIEYFPAKTFDSPFIRGDYGKGIVTISDGRQELVLDFEANRRR